MASRAGLSNVFAASGQREKKNCRERNAQTHHKATKSKRAPETLKNERTPPGHQKLAPQVFPLRGRWQSVPSPAAPPPPIRRIQAGRGELRTQREDSHLLPFLLEASKPRLQKAIQSHFQHGNPSAQPMPLGHPMELCERAHMDTCHRPSPRHSLAGGGGGGGRQSDRKTPEHRDRSS